MSTNITIEALRERLIEAREDLKKEDSRARKALDLGLFGDFRMEHASQEQIAEYLGISRQQYGFFETGSRDVLPDARQMIKLRELYDCEIGYLFGEFDARSREEADVAEATGLSLSSVKNLCDFKDSSVTDFFNRLLQYDQLYELADAVERYAWNEIKTYNLKKVQNHDVLLDAYARSRETPSYRLIFVRQLAKALGVSPDLMIEIEQGQRDALDLNEEERKEYHSFDNYQNMLRLEYERFNRRAYVRRVLERFIESL